MKIENITDNGDYIFALQVTLEAMVRAVKSSLKEQSVELRDVRLNGSAASYVVADSNIDTYNDVDLIFGVNLSEPDSFKRVKEAVGESLLKLLPEQVQTNHKLKHVAVCCHHQ